MNKNIIDLTKEYVLLKEKMDKLEEEIFKVPCMHRELVKAVEYDHVDYYSCVNKDHIYYSAMVRVCSLKLCPLLKYQNQKEGK